MKTKITPFEFITFLIIFMFISTFGFAQGIFENDITGANPNTYNPYVINQVLDVNITSNGIGRGLGIEEVRIRITNTKLRDGTVIPSMRMTILNLP